MKLMWQERPIGSSSASPVLAGRAEAVRAGLVSRRDFLKATGAAMMASLAATAVMPTLALADSKPSRPNIVLILADDLGWPDVSCYGQKNWQTPKIDRLAAEGMRFTSAYAASPVCSPTRASLLTGQYPHRLGMTGILEMADHPYKVPDNAAVLPAETARELPYGVTTVASALREAGYATCIIGKWHVGGHPKDFGFEAWPCFTEGNSQERFIEGKFFTEVRAGEAAKWLRQVRDRPFFLEFSTHAVHERVAAQEAYIREGLQRGLPAKGPWNATYAAYVRHLDDAVGRILDEIDALGLARNTIVFFFSDNGGRGLDVSCNTPWRGGKGQLYEGGIREPLMIRWPGVVPAGKTCDEPVISNDFYPTMLEMAGLSMRPEHHQDGRSFLTLCRGAAHLEPRSLYWHHPHYSTVGVPHSAMRSGNWKIIEYYSDYRREWDPARNAVVETHTKSRLELYNLARDPGEERDLAAADHERASMMQSELRKQLVAMKARFPQPNPSHNPEKPETGVYSSEGKKQ